MDTPPEPKHEFLKWFLTTFTTREHFLRFMGTGVLVLTAWLVVRGTTVPEGWWGILGVVMGYFFRGPPNPNDQH